LAERRQSTFAEWPESRVPLNDGVGKMSIYGGLYSGVSALAAQSTAFGIISDNIANVNTVGYKASSARFQTLVTEGQTATRYTPGGVIARPFSDPEQQGLLQGSSSTTDLAITGNGFFVVNADSAPDPNQDEYLLTRAGSFVPDEDGNLVNTAGFYLQGWATDSQGVVTNATTQDLVSSLETVNVAGFNSTTAPTGDVSMTLNLPATATTGSTETTNLTIFDSLGVGHLLTVNWTADAVANTWDYTVDVTNPDGTVNTIAGAGGTMVFNGSGQLLSVDGAAGAAGTAGTSTIPILAADFGANAGANASNIVINWGNFGSTNGLGQVSGPYQAVTLNQDGSGPSSLTGVDVDQEGFVTAQFANGETRIVYKLALAQVPAATQLTAQSGNTYSLSDGSGDLVLTEAGQLGAGLFESAALESSTVDLAGEFTDLIVTQRSYSAATRIITTGDELLDEIIRVKR
jgi:flagellar hook protein FlgE